MNARKAFGVFALLTVFIMIADRLLFVVFPVYLLERNFSATQIGIIFSLASFILVISRFFIGKLSDIWGRKRVMSLGLLLHSFSASLFPSLTRLYEFSIVKGLREVSETLVKSVEDALIADSFGKKIRARVLARLGAIMPLGRALAMVIGFFVVSYLSLVHGFYFAALFMFLGFLVFVLFFKEERLAKTKRYVKSRKGYSLGLKIIVVMSFLVSVNYTAVYYPAFFVLAESLGITTGLLFILLFIDYVVSGVFAYWSGGWIDNFGRAKTLLLGLVVFSVLTFLYAFVTSALEFLIVLLGISMFYYIFRIAFKTVLMDSTTKGHRGEQIGFSKTAQGLGDMVGPLAGGLLIDFVSLSSVFWFAGLVGLVAVVFAIYLLRIH